MWDILDFFDHWLDLRLIEHLMDFGAEPPHEPQFRLRGIDVLLIEQPFDRAPGLTDVKIIRVLVTSGANQTACAIRAR